MILWLIFHESPGKALFVFSLAQMEFAAYRLICRVSPETLMERFHSFRYELRPPDACFEIQWNSITCIMSHWDVIFAGLASNVARPVENTSFADIRSYALPSEIWLRYSHAHRIISETSPSHFVSAQPQHYPIVSRTPHFAWRCSPTSGLCDHRVIKNMSSLQGLHREGCFGMFRWAHCEAIGHGCEMVTK
jgi:hypothetical protein